MSSIHVQIPPPPPISHSGEAQSSGIILDANAYTTILFSYGVGGEWQQALDRTCEPHCLCLSSPTTHKTPTHTH